MRTEPLYEYVGDLPLVFPFLDLSIPPWALVEQLAFIIPDLLQQMPYSSYRRMGDALIHSNAVVEDGVVIKGHALIMEGCFIAANAYLREGTLLGPNTRIGPGCEVKSSIIAGDTALAHLNYAGNSVLGSHINLEAGAIIANHHNEAPGKTVRIRIGDTVVDTGASKFGALIGDGCKVGANAVLSPGTILPPGQVVARLALVDQTAEE